MSPVTPEAGRRGGFTLLEVIIVLAVMATLMAVVAPVLFTHVGDARITAARSQMEVFAMALDSYYTDAMSYPTTAQGLDALRRRPEAAPVPRRWRGPYLRRAAPADPWDRPYIYVSPGTHDPESYDLSSLGRDGLPGGAGEDADITTWDDVD